MNPRHITPGQVVYHISEDRGKGIVQKIEKYRFGLCYKIFVKWANGSETQEKAVVLRKNQIGSLPQEKNSVKNSENGS